MCFFLINTVLLGRDDVDAPEQSEREPFMYPVPYSFVCLCVRACVRVYVRTLQLRDDCYAVGSSISFINFV